MNSVIFSVSHRLLIDVDIKKIENARNILISSNLNRFRMQNLVCSHCQCQKSSDGIKNPNFVLEKVWG